MEQAQQWLVEWFRRRRKTGKLGPDELLHQNYLEAGWLTSMEIVELVTEIEDNFSIQFSESDLQDPRLVTVHGLAELIVERRAEQSSNPHESAVSPLERERL